MGWEKERAWQIVVGVGMAMAGSDSFVSQFCAAEFGNAQGGNGIMSCYVMA